jgi:hypothetical protein
MCTVWRWTIRRGVRARSPTSSETDFTFSKFLGATPSLKNRAKGMTLASVTKRQRFFVPF